MSISPKPPKIFIELDLSLAEDRDVKIRTGSRRLIRLAVTPPWEIDFHRDAAVKIFKCQPSKITKDQRYLGKRAKHSSNYGATGQKLSDELLKDGFVFTAEECQQMIDVVMEPEVVEWQTSIRKEILFQKYLENAWGRRLKFDYVRLSDDLYRSGYAFKPQSDVSDVMNMWGFVPYMRFLRETGWGAVNIHSHDALLSSVLAKRAYQCAMFLKASLERRLVIEGEPLVFFIELKAGLDWENMIEWKKFPTKTEFEEQVREKLGVGW